MNKQKVCIIGGGLTGLITAATLMKLDLEIDLITENIDQNIKTNRTTAISQDNYNNLRKLKLFNNIEKDFWPCSKMRLYTDNKETKFNQVFELINDRNQNKKILYMIKNSVISKHLIRKLTANLNGLCNLRCTMCHIWRKPNDVYNDENFWIIK